MTANLSPMQDLPDWVPGAVRLYLAHTAEGQSLRAIARSAGVHASTVLRQVRRFESRRDDPLVDCALGRLQGPPPVAVPATAPPAEPEDPAITIQTRPPAPAAPPPDGASLMAEARRLLPLLAVAETVLAVAADLPRSAVLRETTAGTLRLAVLDRPVAEAFALRDWIVCRKPGRVAQYVLTPEGRAMLRKLGVEPARPRPSAMTGAEDEADGRFRPPPETPIAVLARRRDAEGRPFLAPHQVAAAERIHEDYEIAGLEPTVDACWDAYLSGSLAPPEPRPGANPSAARTRVQAALAELGSGLGDVVLRCCCRQDGVETAERELGWSARSGKIVLRIALERLASHYAAQGEAGKRMG